MSWPTSYGFPDAAIASMRELYVGQGSLRGPLCDTRHCLCVATVRVTAWPVLPSEEHPIYCDYCAAAAKRVLETLGHKYADVALPVVAGPARAIVVGGG